jgi:RNA polymerase sigma-70 factor (ECF subfamily)
MVDSGEKALPGLASATAPRERSADPAVRALDELMDRFARGDDAAFSDLYRQGAPRVRGFLTRLSGDPALADDLTQDTFLRVHRARGNFAAGAAALPWMFAIGRNAFLDHARRAEVRRTEHRDSPGRPQAEGTAPASSRGDEALVAREMLDIVQATLDGLPALQREAFVLLRFESLSVSEAALILATTEGAVKVRAFRAYEALRAALARQSGGAKP